MPLRPTLLAIAVTATAALAADPCSVRIESTTGKPSVLVSRDGKRFETTLYEAQCLGELPAVGRTPYLLLAGYSCGECDADIGVFVHATSDGPMPEEASLERHPFPGWTTDPLSGERLDHARLFIGGCLEDGDTPRAVWFLEERDDEGRLRRHALVLDVTGGKLRRRVDPSPAPDVAFVTSRTASGSCREIPGKDRAAEP